MRRIPTFLLPVALTVIAGLAVAGPAPFDTSWPGDKPELFAPGIVNTDGVEINLVFKPEYTELFFSRTVDKAFFVYTSRLVDGTWTAPERLDLYGEGVRGEAVDMALSTDGRWLYFLGITSEGEAKQRDIWMSARKGGGWSPARRLGPSVNTGHSEFYPTVVADGSLYFVSDRPSELGPRNVYKAVRRADGSFEPAVPVGPPIDTEQAKGDTFVAPDESYLIFSSSDREGYGSGDLFVAFRTTGGGWSEPKNMGTVINTEELEFCPIVSPDGRWLSFSRRYGETWPTTTDAEIYWMDAAIIEELRPAPTTIVFCSDRDGDSDIYAMNDDGSAMRQITNSESREIDTASSPDGLWVAFVSDRDGNYEVYVMRIDGTSVQRLTDHPALDVNPEWSPDGSRIAFESDRDGDREIWLVNRDGTGLRQLTFNTGADGGPDWSPDGSRIAFQSDRSGHFDIWTMTPTGGDPRSLTDDAPRDFSPCWSPDGARLVFLSERDGPQELYLMEPDGGNVERLTHTSAENHEPDWSPDGTRIVFASRRETNLDILVIGADGTGPANLTNHGGMDRGPTWLPARRTDEL